MNVLGTQRKIYTYGTFKFDEKYVLKAQVIRSLRGVY